MSAESDLRALLADGQIPGPWSMDAVLKFDHRCSEWLAEHGDACIALLDAAQAHVPTCRFGDALAAACDRLTKETSE